MLPAAYPIHTPITSSMAMASDMIRVRVLFTPASKRGEMITIPSGMFWSAIPNDTVHAFEMSVELNPTPAAMPSGSLWSAMAMTNSIIRFNDELLVCCSGSSPVMWCMCGVTKSRRLRNIAPTITPIATNHHCPLPACSAAGTMSPRTDAASITPAQKPMTVSFHL